MAKVYLKGLPQFRARLAKIASAAEDQTRKTLAKSAETVAQAIRSRAPWNKLKAPGVVGWTFGVPPKYAQVIAKAEANGIVVTIYVGNSRTRTAAWAEYGTKPRLQGGYLEGKGVMHPGTTAKPFFWPGWRATRGVARRMLQAEIKAAIQRAKR